MKPGYKQTEVGVIPEDWAIISLGSACIPGGLVRGPFGGSLKKDIFVNSGKKVYEQRNAIYRDARIGNYFIDETKFKELERFSVLAGDFIISCAGTIGRIFRIPATSHPGVINQALLKLRINEQFIDSNFFYYYFDWESFQAKIIENTHGGAMQNLVGMEVFRSIPIPFPPLPEQQAIAAALSDVDALLGGLERLIAKKRDLKQAAMQQLLTGQTRLPGFHGEWEVKRLGEVGEISSAGVDKKILLDEVPVRLVNYLDVYHKDFIYSKDLSHWVTAPPQQAKRCAVQKGDVFFTPTSETRDDIGNSAVAMEDIPDAAYSYHVARLRLHESWDLCFRTYIFKTRAFLDQAETLCDGNGTRYVISQGKFRSMTVQVPPLPEQIAIAEVLSDMDAELATLELRRDKTRELKQAMMQELLTGRTRLI